MENLLDTVLYYLSLDFVKTAFAVGIPVALCAALLGVSLTMKKYAMIGDGLSHVGFATLSVAAVMNLSNSLLISIPVVIIAAFLILRINANSKIKGDSAIAIISTSAIAVGYIVSYRLANGSTADVCNYMFGSMLTIPKAQVIPCVVLAFAVIALFVLLYNRIFTVTFDETFAKATGVNAALYNDIIALLTAVTIVLGMKIMGTLLVSALIVFPAVTAKTVCKSFKKLVIFSALSSIICCCIGIVASILLETPAGSTIVILNLICFAIFYCASKLKTAR